MQTILQQLQAAHERSGLTMEELARQLRKREGIRLDRSTLRRQMRGLVPMRTEVVEGLARVMSVTLAVVPDEAA